MIKTGIKADANGNSSYYLQDVHDPLLPVCDEDVPEVG
jgi:hypothetical protein